MFVSEHVISKKSSYRWSFHSSGAQKLIHVKTKKIQESQTDVIIISAVLIQWLSHCWPIHPVLRLVVHCRSSFRQDCTKHLKLNNNLQA